MSDAKPTEQPDQRSSVVQRFSDSAGFFDGEKEPAVSARAEILSMAKGIQVTNDHGTSSKSTK